MPDVSLKFPDGSTRSYDAATTGAALAEGLVILSCGVHANTIRLLMPLTISDALLEEGMGKLERALVAAAG